jgi:hypothetical protein
MPKFMLKILNLKLAPEDTRDPSSTPLVDWRSFLYFIPNTPNDTLNDTTSCMNTHSPGLKFRDAVVDIVRVSRNSSL